MSELFGIKKVGHNRYREDPGRYVEDFNVGDIYEHWPGRTITETDNIWFTNLTMNTLCILMLIMPLKQNSNVIL